MLILDRMNQPIKPFPQFCRALRRERVAPCCVILCTTQTQRLLQNMLPFEDALRGIQAVRSLGRLSCTGYPVCTCRLATRWSAWDLDLDGSRWDNSSWGRLRA